MRRLLEGNAYSAPELRKDGRFYGIFSFSADIYALGMILYAVATDTVPNVSDPLPENVELLKRRVARDVSSKFPNRESISRVIDKCLRQDPRDRFKCADEMLDFVLNAVSSKSRKELMKRVNRDLKIHAAGFTESFVSKLEKEEPPRRTFLHDQLQRFFERAALNQGINVKHGHCEYWGTRDELLNHLCDFMSVLTSGDRYSTVTVPGYWTEENLGSTGRFMVKNKDAAREGVSIKRVFLVCYPFDELPLDEQLVLINQFDAQQDIIRESHPPEKFDIRVRVVPDSDLRDIERRRNMVAFARFSKGPSIGLSFMSHGTPRSEYDLEFWRLSITKIRFSILDSHPLDQGEHEKRFLENFEKATPIEDYIQGSSLKIDDLLDQGLRLGRDSIF